MTEAEHADLSRRLALAIGWPENAVYVTADMCFIWFGRDGYGFDYRDPLVIWPIAERFACFPFKHSQGGWWAWCPGQGVSSGKHGDTAAEAVARAVVGARG